MTLLLAAVGAVVTALIELTVTPYLRIGSAQPHPVLVLGVIVAIAVGLEAGLAWAFVGGLALDVLAQRPLGSTAFALLLCVGGASILARSLVRSAPDRPDLRCPGPQHRILDDLVRLFRALGPAPPSSDPLVTVLPGAVYDAVLAAVIGPLTVAVHDRRLEQERVDW